MKRIFLMLFLILMGLGTVRAGILYETDFTVNDTVTLPPEWKTNNDMDIVNQTLVSRGSLGRAIYDYNFPQINLSWRMWEMDYDYTNVTRIEVFFHRQSNSSATVYSGYKIQYIPNSNQLKLFYDAVELEAISGIVFSETDVVKINTSTVATGLRIYKNDVSFVTFNVTNSSYTFGWIGFGSQNTADDVAFDDILVESLSDLNITSWENDYTDDQSLSFNVVSSSVETIVFNVTANAPSYSLHCFVDSISSVCSNQTFSLDVPEYSGLHTVEMYAENSYGESNHIIWNVTIFPYFVSWGNNYTYDNKISFETDQNDFQFNTTAIESVSSQSWFVNSVDQSNNNNVFNKSFVTGEYNVSTYIQTVNGSAYLTWRLYVVDVIIAPPNSYYLSMGGLDSNSGNLTHPFANVSKAIGTLKAGDSLYIVDGSYIVDGKVTFSTGGNATHRIIIERYNGTPILKSNKNGTWINAEDFGYITINNITFENFSYKQNYPFTSGALSTNNTFRGLTITNSNQFIVGKHDIRFTDSQFINGNWNGIQLTSRPCIVSNNYYIDNITFTGFHKHGIIDLFGTLNNVTINNVRSDNASFGGIYYHKLSCGGYLSNVVITNSYFQDYVDPTASGAVPLKFDRGENFLIENITFNRMHPSIPIQFHGENNPQNLKRNITVRNVTYLNGSAGSIIGLNQVTDILVENCTINSSATGSNGGYRIGGINVTNLRVRNPIDKKSIFMDGGQSPNNTFEFEFYSGKLINATGNLNGVNISKKYHRSNGSYVTIGSNLARNVYLEEFNVSIITESGVVDVYNTSSALFINNSGWQQLDIIIGSDISNKTLNFTNQTVSYLTLGAENITVVGGVANFSTKSPGSYVVYEASGATVNATTDGFYVQTNNGAWNYSVLPYVNFSGAPGSWINTSWMAHNTTFVTNSSMVNYSAQIPSIPSPITSIILSIQQIPYKIYERVSS